VSETVEYWFEAQSPRSGRLSSNFFNAVSFNGVMRRALSLLASAHRLDGFLKTLSESRFEVPALDLSLVKQGTISNPPERY
jgi:hypothetical protein